MRNLSTIKACGLELSTLKKWHNLFSQKLIIQDKLTIINIVTLTLSKFVDVLSIFLVLILGSVRVSKGCLTVGNLMVYYALHLYFYNSLNSLMQGFKDTQVAYPNLLRVQDILNHKKDHRYQNNNGFNLDKDFVFRCEEMSFYFNQTEKPILNKINIEIYAGENVALVGKSGSGKSTLAKILCGLYSAQHGLVTLSGVDIASLSATDLSKSIAYVSQDNHLLAGTIYDNLHFWRDYCSEETIKKAIKTACLIELINEKTLQGKVEESGNNFSGGEKQRIDIARALIQDTAILILDEASSALDVQTELQLINNLRKLNKTIIYVAHRLSTIAHCDKIIVLEEGEVKEIGTHMQLIRNQSSYYDLVQHSSSQTI